MPCYRVVDHISCRYCQGITVKFGKIGASQRYRCKICRKIQLSSYKKHAYAADINDGYAMPGLPTAYTAPTGADLSTRGELTGTQTNVPVSYTHLTLPTNREV